MNREYTITVYEDGSSIITAYGTQIYEPVLLGYDGEDEATELTINMPDEGSFYLDWFYNGAWHEGTTEYTDDEFTYDVTDTEVVIGDVYMRVRAGTFLSDPIKFVVKP